MTSLRHRLGKLRPEARKIMLASSAGALMAIAYILIAPRWYQSKLTVLPTSPARVLPSSAGGAEAASSSSGSSDVERIAAVFQSAAVSDAVVEKFNLGNRYQSQHAEQARSELWSHCAVATDRRARLVSISCEDKDPLFARELLIFMGDRTNQVIRQLGARMESEEARFLERRVAEVQKAADDSALKLREFQERYKIIDLDAQSRAVVSALASLRGQQISKELELLYLKTFSARSEATASQIRRQLSAMTNEFSVLSEYVEPSLLTNEREAALPKPKASTASMFPPAMLVPKLQYELSQRMRDRKSDEENLGMLKQRLEMVKADQAREISAFLVLDSPSLSSVKSRPRGSLALAAGIALGLLAGVAWSLGPRYLRSAWTVLRSDVSRGHSDPASRRAG